MTNDKANRTIELLQQILERLPEKSPKSIPTIIVLPDLPASPDKRLRVPHAYERYWNCPCGRFLHNLFGRPLNCPTCGRDRNELKLVTARSVSIIPPRWKFWAEEEFEYELSPFQK